MPEKCEVCGEVAVQSSECGIFTLMFCQKHYDEWCHGMSIAHMQARERGESYFGRY